MKRVFFFSFLLLVLTGVFFYREIFVVSPVSKHIVQFDVAAHTTAHDLAVQLKKDGVIRHIVLFEHYLRFHHLDTKITPGEYRVAAPATIARIGEVLGKPGQGERTITIIPGWDLRDVAEYFEKEGIASSTLVLRLGKEGYLAPNTYRVYRNAAVDVILGRFLEEREKELEGVEADIAASRHTIHEILTMASILEKEVQTKEDKAKAADIFWRRLEAGMALQADSTVHYAVGGSSGSVFTSAKDRAIDSPWNTYKYPGLPRGPICNPGMDSILAAIHPEKNDYWYFLTTQDGEVKYAKTIEEHNLNRAKYLR